MFIFYYYIIKLTNCYFYFWRLNPSQTSNRQAPISKSITKPIISEPKINNNTEKKLTDYFPVRRSVRKTKNTVLEERQRDLEDAILAEKEDGLEVFL